MRTPRSKAAIHTAFFYAAMFGALGAHLPFWPVWLQDWGLSAGEVGLYTALGVASRVVAGLGFPVLADRLGRRRLTMVALCLTASALFAAHVLIGSKAMLLVATIATGALLSGILPLGEALGTGASRAFGFGYASARSLGSVAFLITALAVGALTARIGAPAILWWLVLALIATAALGWRHPGGGTGQTAKPPSFREIGALLTDPTFALFSLAAGMCLSSHAVFYAYGSVHWRGLGLSEDLIGALWAFSVAVEIVVMLALGPRVMAALGATRALVISGIAGVLRWGLMTLDPPTASLWVLQSLHSVTFVVGHLGAIAFIAAAVPERYGASAQGAFMGLTGGVLTAVAMAVSALVYPSIGGGAYGIAALMSGVGALLAWQLGRRWHGKELAV